MNHGLAFLGGVGYVLAFVGGVSAGWVGGGGGYEVGFFVRVPLGWAVKR